MTDLHIRYARPEDAARLADFNQRMARETEGRSLEPDRLRAGVEAALADPARGRYHVAESGGELVGGLLITREWSDWRNAWFWWIQSVYVPPEHRGRGTFRALYDHVAREAREAPDVCGLRLYVERENTRAIAVYERLGMVDAGYRLLELDWH
ncbi:MAG: N-acetyltransferase family protein [Myxococcota bacterium]